MFKGGCCATVIIASTTTTTTTTTTSGATTLDLHGSSCFSSFGVVEQVHHHFDHLLYFPDLFETQREAVVEELHHLYKPFFPKSQPLSPRTIPISFLSDKIIYWAIFPSHSHIWWTSPILKTSNMTSWMVYLSVTVLYNSHQLCKLYGPRANVKVQLGIKHNSPLILIILFSNSYLKNIKYISIILLKNLSKYIYIYNIFFSIFKYI